MFKNALVYRIDEAWTAPSLDELEARLAAGRFNECAPTQLESTGWTEPRGKKHGALVESIGGHWMLRLSSERKAVPASVVKTELEARLEAIEAQTGRKPRGKAAKELKEQIVHALLPRAFAKRGSTPLWIDPRARVLVIGATSTKKADGIVTLLVDLLGASVAPMPMQSQRSPAGAMAGWLAAKEAPAGFSIDRECELKQPDSEKALVRYARHTLDIDEVAAHIGQGKLPTQLAMTWQGRVSFVLTEAMTLKKIKLLDVVLEGSKQAANDGADDGFDADVAITTGELGRMIPDLIEALGGELDRKQPLALAA